MDGEAAQVVRHVQDFPLPLHVLEASPELPPAAAVERLCQIEAERPFDLTCDLMLRASLLQLADDEHILLLTMHHIASDGWSLDVLWRELELLYNAYSLGNQPQLPELAVQYADYAVWQRAQLQGPYLDELLSYWRGQLADLDALELPSDRPVRPCSAIAAQVTNLSFPPTWLSVYKL